MTAMNPFRLQYFFDPLCGWCYASAPALAGLDAAHPGVLELMPSGLFADEGARELTPEWGEYAWRNDQRIEQMTGQRFTHAYREQVLRRGGVRFDSGPANRALSALRGVDARLERPLLEAIQLALYAKARVKTFGGPMLSADFGAPTPSEFTLAHFWQTLTQPTTTIVSDVPQTQVVNASGTLWGGNLAILASLVGTPYMPQIEGGILFVEDVNEQPFRIERMIYQLHLAGILARQQALVLGQFTGARPFDYDNGYDMQAMIEQVRGVIGIPIVTGLQFGHVPDLLTLPFGARAELVANEHGFRLTMSDYPHLAA